MKTFHIEARETLFYTFNVEAETRKEAREMVLDGTAFENGMPDAHDGEGFEITHIS